MRTIGGAWVVFVCSIAYAQDPAVTRVEYPMAGGERVAALYAHPRPGEKRAAVIYNHGRFIELVGLEGAKARGYDVADFVRAFARDGYACLAPIRREGPRVDRGVVRGGLDWLAGRPDVDAARVGVVGFSKGAVFALQAAIEQKEVKAAVLMSGAMVGPTDRGPLKELYDRLERIRCPILVTLGKGDDADLQAACRQTLLPRLERAGVKVEQKLDYPGNHQWFYQVRPEHWPDVRAFLAKHLPAKAGS